MPAYPGTAGDVVVAEPLVFLFNHLAYAFQKRYRIASTKSKDTPPWLKGHKNLEPTFIKPAEPFVSDEQIDQPFYEEVQARWTQEYVELEEAGTETSSEAMRQYGAYLCLGLAHVCCALLSSPPSRGG